MSKMVGLIMEIECYSCDRIIRESRSFDYSSGGSIHNHFEPYHITRAALKAGWRVEVREGILAVFCTDCQRSGRADRILDRDPATT